MEDFDEAKNDLRLFWNGGKSKLPTSLHPFPKLVSQFELPRAGSVIEPEMLLRCPCIWGGLYLIAKYNVVSLICMIPASIASFYIEETKKVCVILLAIYIALREHALTGCCEFI